MHPFPPNPIRLSLLTAALAILLCPLLTAQDVDLNLNMVDPEFDTVEHQVTWQSLSGRYLWATDVDPLTGDIAYAQRIVVDENILPVSVAFNGPEWAFSSQGSQIIYGKENAQGAGEIVRAFKVGGVWQPPVVLPNTVYPRLTRAGAVGSLNVGDPEPKILYGVDIRHLPFQYEFVPVWRDLLNPGQEHVLPREYWDFAFEVGIGRWVENRRSIITTKPVQVGPDSVYQCFEYHLDGTELQLTNDTQYHMGDSFMWEDHEDPNGGHLFFCGSTPVHPQPGDNWSGLRFYDQTAAGQPGTLLWEFDPRTLGLPIDYRYIISPEPFVKNGISYVSFIVSTEQIASHDGDSFVYHARPHVPNSVVLVSDNTVMVRKDPEPFIGPTDAWIFYTEKRPGPGPGGFVRIVHRCLLNL